MKRTLDCSLINLILQALYDNSGNSTRVYGHPVFQTLLAHTQDFRQKPISAEAYFCELLRVSGMDKERNRDGIFRNLRLIETVDWDEICRDTAGFLPTYAAEGFEKVRIVPCIGVAGLALRDCIVMDPSPCPWFPDGVTDPGAYTERYVKATMRHELHHIGYARIRTSPPMEKIRSLRDLAGDFALQIQMEGGAMMCQMLGRTDPRTAEQMQGMQRRLRQYLSVLDRWIAAGETPPDKAALDFYFSLWAEDKPVYRLGQAICSLLMQSGIVHSVGACMEMDPMAMLHAAYDILTKAGTADISAT